MKIVNIDQGSSGWDELRAKRMTASHAQAIALCGKGLDTYVTGIMENIYSTEEKEGYYGKDMERGNELEDSAGFVYEADTGIITQKVGFVIHSEFAGCSPDLFAEDKTGKGLAEIKCPAGKEFFRRLLGGPIESKYIWQMQAQLMMCKRDWVDHVIYNPNFKKYLIVDRIFPDEKKINAISRGLFMGEKLMKEIEAKMEIVNA